MVDSVPKTEKRSNMKKFSLIVLVVLLVSTVLTSCMSLNVLGSALETKNEEYVLEKTDDIYGHHEVKAVLFAKQVEGHAAVDIGLRLKKEYLNDALNADFGYQLNVRYIHNVAGQSVYPTSKAMAKIDGKVYDLGYIFTSNLEGLNGSEVDIKLKAEVVEALKNATEVSFQVHETLNGAQMIEVPAEGVEAIKSFIE